MRRHKWKFFIVGLALAIVMLGFVPWSKTVALSNGGYARFTPASFFNDLRLEGEASSTISYQPKHGRAGKIVLWADLFDGPIMVMPASDTNVLLCLYDFDISLRLFRIDTSKEFKPLSPDNSIKRILFSSTWEIDYGTSADWEEVLNYVKNVSPSVFAHQSVPVGTFKMDTPQYILAWVGTHGVTIRPE